MDIKHLFKLENNWTGNKGSGTADVAAYSRLHQIKMEDKPDLQLTTADTHRGDKGVHNPEDLLLASVSSCHMLSYLYLCAKANVIVFNYIDTAEGIMIEHEKGGGHFKNVLLKPTVTIASEDMRERAIKLHHKAHEICYIASSVNFEIEIQPEIIIQT
ncbi:MAG TPA: OsmC family protein [Bacteroidia bacterium]